MIKNILIGVFAVAIIGSIVFLSIPTFQSISALKKQIEINQKTLDEEKVFISKVETLIEKYDLNQETFKKLDFILPGDPDVPNLIVQLEALTKDNGMILNDMQISSVEGEKTVGYGTITISLKLSGDYQTFRNFLQAAENNIRLADIDSINLVNKEDNGVFTFEYDVNLNTYYRAN